MEEVMDILRRVNYTGVTFLVVAHSEQLASFARWASEMVNRNLVDRFTFSYPRTG